MQKSLLDFNFYGHITEALDLSILVIDENGKVVHANPFAHASLQQGDTQLIGRQIQEIIHNKEDVITLFKTGSTLIEEIATFLFKEDGTKFLADCKIKKLPINENVFYVIWFSEIDKTYSYTYLKLESLKLLRAVLDYSPNYVFVKDLAHRFLLINRTYVEALKAAQDHLKIQKTDLDESDFLGKKDSEIFPEQYAAEFSRDDDIVFATGKTIQVEYKVKIGEEERIFLTSKAPLYDAKGRIFALCGIASNITPLKNIEALQNDYLIALEKVTTELMEAKILSDQADVAKNAFLSSMSHEIRTPLNGVIGNASLLMHTELDAKQQTFTERILHCAKNLLEIIDKILDYAKIASFGVSIQTREFNLQMLIEEVLEEFKERAQDKNLALKLHYSKEIPLTILSDSLRIRQILINLMDNAIKFTDKGGVTITLIHINKNQEHRMRFEIADTGSGITQELQSKLFKKFFQVDTSFTRKYTGLGLGLATSKLLINKLGGAIGLQSTEGKGCTFWFEIPIKLPKV